jgi:mono/diheme cytochrome c family protein
MPDFNYPMNFIYRKTHMKNSPTKSIIVAFLLFPVTLVLLSGNQTDNNTKSAQITEKTTQSISPQKVLSGNELYTKYCLSCHQANGSGVPGMIPPLGPGSWVGKSPDELIILFLKGLKGEIEVNGEIYKNVMPVQPQITDQELANVLTYVRSSFGNKYSPITPLMVAKVRQGL